eukprot:6150575-Amphidinium_carterae.1
MSAEVPGYGDIQQGWYSVQRQPHRGLLQHAKNKCFATPCLPRGLLSLTVSCVEHSSAPLLTYILNLLWAMVYGECGLIHIAALQRRLELFPMFDLNIQLHEVTTNPVAYNFWGWQP